MCVSVSVCECVCVCVCGVAVVGPKLFFSARVVAFIVCLFLGERVSLF